MELCHRGDLRGVLEHLGPYTPETGELLWDWFTTMLGIIKFLEEKRVLHRDLKTDNFFVTAHNQLKLGDWGYACLKGEEGEQQPGTVGCVAPEVGNGRVHAKSDVYHLGLILKEMRKQKEGMPTRPGDVWPGSLLHLNVCMLQDNPERRPSIDECIEMAKLARADWPFA